MHALKCTSLECTDSCTYQDKTRIYVKKCTSLVSQRNAHSERMVEEAKQKMCTSRLTEISEKTTDDSKQRKYTSHVSQRSCTEKTTKDTKQKMCTLRVSKSCTEKMTERCARHVSLGGLLSWNVISILLNYIPIIKIYCIQYEWWRGGGWAKEDGRSEVRASE